MMNMIFSIWTVVVFVLFIAIAIWAWSSHNKKDFEAAARIPLDDDDDVAGQPNDNIGEANG